MLRLNQGNILYHEVDSVHYIVSTVSLLPNTIIRCYYEKKTTCMSDTLIKLREIIWILGAKLRHRNLIHICNFRGKLLHSDHVQNE